MCKVQSNCNRYVTLAKLWRRKTNPSNNVCTRKGGNSTYTPRHALQGALAKQLVVSGDSVCKQSVLTCASREGRGDIQNGQKLVLVVAETHPRAAALYHRQSCPLRCTQLSTSLHSIMSRCTQLSTSLHPTIHFVAPNHVHFVAPNHALSTSLHFIQRRVLSLYSEKSRCSTVGRGQ